MDEIAIHVRGQVEAELARGGEGRHEGGEAEEGAVGAENEGYRGSPGGEHFGVGDGRDR